MYYCKHVDTDGVVKGYESRNIPIPVTDGVIEITQTEWEAYTYRDQIDDGV